MGSGWVVGCASVWLSPKQEEVMKHLDTSELWQLLTLVWNSRDYGHGSELAIKLEQQIATNLRG